MSGDYGLLKAINEDNLPAFDEWQEAFVKYVSEMLPLVRPYEYLIIQKIVGGVGMASLEEISEYVKISMNGFAEPVLEHTLLYMVKKGFFIRCEEEGAAILRLYNMTLNTELDEYLRDLLVYGLGKYDAEFVELEGRRRRICILILGYQDEA